MLKVENLCAAYGNVQVLWDISLEVKTGKLSQFSVQTEPEKQLP